MIAFSYQFDIISCRGREGIKKQLYPGTTKPTEGEWDRGAPRVTPRIKGHIEEWEREFGKGNLGKRIIWKGSLGKGVWEREFGKGNLGKRIWEGEFGKETRQALEHLDRKITEMVMSAENKCQKLHRGYCEFSCQARYWIERGWAL